MNLYFRLILILVGIAYLISPVDIIPDFLLPYIGFTDDAMIIYLILYLIKNGRLPHFLYKHHKQSNAHTQTGNDFEKDKGSDKTSSDPQREKTPYDILGIRPGSSKQEIISAYKNAVKKYHPDKLSHLGEDFAKLANEKFVEIQKAYDTLMR